MTSAALDKKAAGISAGFEAKLAEKLSVYGSEIYAAAEKLEAALTAAADIASSKEAANFYHDSVLSAMEELRTVADKAEALLGEKYLPYPTYGELLFGVND